MCAYRIRRLELLGQHKFDMYDVSDSEENIGQEDFFVRYTFADSCDKIEKKHNNWHKEVDQILSIMEHVAKGQRLPITKYRVLKTNGDIQFFEIKKNHLRAYGFLDVMNKYIVCFMGIKKNQKKDIPTLYRKHELMSKAGYYPRNPDCEGRPPFLFTRHFESLTHVQLTQKNQLYTPETRPV